MIEPVLPRNGSLLLVLAFSLVLLSGCPDPSAPDDSGQVSIIDGPARHHPREMTTAATLFNGAIEARALRLQAQVLSQGDFCDPKNRDFLEAEMRKASVDLEAVNANQIAQFRKGETESAGAWLMVSLGPDDAVRRIMLTREREEGQKALGPGSSALSLTVFLETLRLCTLSRVAAETPSSRVAIDFVLVLDGSTGFEFLNALPDFKGRYVGILTAEELTSSQPAKRILLGRVDRPESVLANCLESVLADFSGQPAAWGEVGFEGDLAEIAAEFLGHEDGAPIPRAELRAASGPKGRNLVLLPDIDERIQARAVPALHEKIGTEADRVDQIAGKGFPLSLALARALTLVLLRCEASFELQ